MGRRKKKLSDEDVRVGTERARLVSGKKYDVVGRTVVQFGEWAGRPAGRMGWVVSTWPETVVLFEDGRLADVHSELDAVLGPIDEIVEDVESLIGRIVRGAGENRTKVQRKSQYS